MKSIVGNGKDFEFNSKINSKINRKPMEIFKNRCNVTMWQNFGETVTTRAAAF